MNDVRKEDIIMRERTIKITPFEFLNVTKLNIYKNINEHGSAEIIGLIAPENAQTILTMQGLGSSAAVRLFDENSNEQILFNGLIQNISLENIGDAHTMHLDLVSKSIEMDQVKHTRTFQDISMSYDHVFDIVCKDSGIGRYYINQYSEQAIEKLIVQYEETDWEFAKRVASRLNTVIVSDFRLDHPCLSIGLPYGAQTKRITSTDYTVGSDNIESFHSSNYNPIYYTVKSREYYELAAAIEFQGVSLLVGKVETELVGAELVHTYTLRHKSGFVTHEYYNQNLIGASLIGNIEEVQKDLVKVKIQNDVVQSDYIWFSYATVYSSPDNTGWYFMPEIGDEVRLHFPTDHEWKSYVISSVHLGGRADADTKSIRTKWGKEIIFTPTSIYINNGAGSNILLDDESGIKIATNKTVDISAEKDIKIDAVGKIDIIADEGVTISQADNVIAVDEVIDISAEYVRVE